MYLLRKHYVSAVADMMYSLREHYAPCGHYVLAAQALCIGCTDIMYSLCEHDVPCGHYVLAAQALCIGYRRHYVFTS